MAIDREYLKKKVNQGIEQLPSQGIVVREALNEYNEKEGYYKVAELTGILYSNTTNRSFDININNSGVNFDTNDKNFMVVYDDNSKSIDVTDIIFIDNESFKVNDLGENLKIYCLMRLIKHKGLRLEGDNIIEDDIIYPLLTVPKRWLNEY